jgi:serine/threonine-protein kinase
LTQSGVVAGTPNYMAPQQARGEAVDHRADLFSLGSTLYAMCTGHPPFRAESAVAVLRRVSDDEPRPVREINPEVPGWLGAIIAKLQAKDPADRFQSASEVTDLLSRWLAHVQQPLMVPLPTDALPVPAGPVARRLRRLRSAIAVLVIAVFVGGTLLLWRGRVTGLQPVKRASVQTRPIHPPRVPTSHFTRREPEEIDRLLDAASGSARTMEADLHRRAGPAVGERVSAFARDVSAQAQALEQEIAHANGRDPALANPRPRPLYSSPR